MEWSEEPLPGDVARLLPSLPSRRSGDGLVGDSDLEQREGAIEQGSGGLAGNSFE